MITPVKLLGKLGSKLPVLKESEWHTIFEFLEFYMTTDKVLSTKQFDDTSFDWAKIKQILMLLNKIE